MNALKCAKELGRDAIFEKIKAAGLKMSGLRMGALAEQLKACSVGAAVDAGLDNADTDGALLALLRENPERVLEGIKIAALALNTGEANLYLPEKESELAAALQPVAEKYDIKICSGIVDVRKTEGDFYLHLASAADLADLFTDSYEDGVYVAVNGQPLKKVARDTKLGQLTSLDGAKAIWTGYHYYTPAEAEELTVEAASNALVRVLTDKECLVEETKKQLTEYRRVSCGKCVFCREGLIQLEHEQREITLARGKMDFLDLTKEIGEAMRFSNLCSVGQRAAYAPLNAVEKFPEEYESHIKKNQCPAGVCGAFVHIYIDPKLCTGCGECLDVCPEDCIEGKPKYIHMIDEFDCTKCGKCIEVCEDEAIIQTAGKLPKLPNRLTKVGKFRKH